MIEACDINTWVTKAPDRANRHFREAVHVVLLAIATSAYLNVKMIMKGAVLLAVRYDSSRFTRDIDFSTNQQLAEFDEDEFLVHLGQGLIHASEILDYGMDCKIQTHKIKPANSPDVTYPTLTLTIGYAHIDDRNSHKRLMKKQASKVVKVDYSFNEITNEIDSLQLRAGGELCVYSFTDLIAEKFRAILQQKVRNRIRRQDAYDLYCLFQDHPPLTDEEKIHILSSLQVKSISRKLEVHKNSMADSEIIQRSKEEYHTLENEIEGELPEFNTVYSKVQAIYESLPWTDKELMS